MQLNIVEIHNEYNQFLMSFIITIHNEEIKNEKVVRIQKIYV